MQRYQIITSILGFIFANIGIAAIWSSIKVEFWLDSAETVKFLIVTIIFGTISLTLFKKVVNLNSNQFSEKQLSRMNSQQIAVIAVLLGISFIIIFVTLSTFGTIFLDIILLSTSFISSLICNIFIYNQLN